MSSTEFTVGLEGGRNSSKVLKPPGGGSSDIFGVGSGASNVVKDQRGAENTTQDRLFGGSNTATPRTKALARRNPITGEGYDLNDNKASVRDVIDIPRTPDEEEKFIQDSSVSEKANELPNTETPKVVQTSIRVRNPPGGKSSGIF